MKMRKGGILVVLIIVVLIIACTFLGVLVFGGSRIFRASPTVYLTPTPSQTIGDIDRSGAVDTTDSQFVQTNLGCKKGDGCWQKVIGKTRDGDNPIYVFDVDLNKDGVISQIDLDLVK